MKSADCSTHLTVRVKPGARESALSIENGAIVVRVRERAYEGRANEGCRKAVAAALGVPETAVRLVAGARSKYKRFEIAGLGKPAMSARLHGLTKL